MKGLLDKRKIQASWLSAMLLFHVFGGIGVYVMQYKPMSMDPAQFQA